MNPELHPLHPLRAMPDLTAEQKAIRSLKGAFTEAVAEAAKTLQLYADDHAGKVPPAGRAWWAVNPATFMRLHVGRPDCDADPKTLSIWGIPVRSIGGTPPGELVLMISYQLEK